jgi:hypothetical protein
MLRIQMIGLAIMAALAMSAVAAGSASAALEWLINGAPITKAKTVESLGTLQLEDHSLLSGNTKVECKGKDEGTVGPGGVDLISKITGHAGELTVTCTFINTGNCNASPAPLAMAVNLPWKTLLLTEANGEIRDTVESDGNGEPGWEVKCTVGSTVTTDTCTGTTSTGMDNVLGVGVDALFDAKSAHAKCSIGGTGAGVVTGTDVIKNPSPTELLTVM